jgi:hypothetical protein
VDYDERKIPFPDGQDEDRDFEIFSTWANSAYGTMYGVGLEVLL